MSREIGDELEEKVSKDLGLRKTCNSGAKFGNGDLSNHNFIVECKVKNGADSLASCGSEIKKLKSQARKVFKDWLYVQQTATSAYVVLDYDVFIELWEKAQSLED